jgi:hypothetical protein
MHLRSRLLTLTGMLTLVGSGCSSTSTTIAPTGSVPGGGIPAPQKVRAEAPPNQAAMAAGGSGMPSPAQSSTKSGPLPAGGALVDAPSNRSAEASGGSGMPGPN